LREVPVQQIDSLGGLGSRCHGALEKIGQKKAALLEVGKDFFLGLRYRGDRESGEKIAGEAGERNFGGIEKFGIRLRCRSGEHQGLDMDGTAARGPFEALEAASDVLARGQLAAAIAR
jgi:hypothetical protein